MPLTTRGSFLILNAYFRDSTEETNFYIALVTSAVVPTHATKLLSELTEIAAGNGYTSGGYQLNRDTTDFNSITEEDVDQFTRIGLKPIVFTASGASIPASGSPARYLVLTTGEATVANRQIIMYESLTSDRIATAGLSINITALEIQIRGGSMLDGEIQRGTIDMAGAASGTATLSPAVDTTKSEVKLTGYEVTAGSPTAAEIATRLTLTNSTTVTATRGSTTGSVRVGFEVRPNF